MDKPRGHVNAVMRALRMEEHGVGTAVLVSTNGSVQVNDGERLEVSIFPKDAVEARGLFEQLEPVEIVAHRINPKDWHTVLRKQIGPVSMTVHTPLWTTIPTKAACHAFWMGDDGDAEA